MPLKFKHNVIICFLVLSYLFNQTVETQSDLFPLIEGKLVFHSFSDYEAWDSKLFIYDFAEQLLTEISQDWDIDHAMNAHFSPDGSRIVFMGVPKEHHDFYSWDIYIWNLLSDHPINLTANNGLRDEDPKFSPNGNEIVFKQNGDLVVIDLINDTMINTTNNGFSIEQSMPYFKTDNQNILYAQGAGISSDIYLINKDGTDDQPLENIINIQEYYPITWTNSIFLYTRWVSISNHHDQIYLGYFSGENSQSLPFNDENADDSDPFPVNSDFVFFSSNRSGGQGGWDLYLGDKNSSTIWQMDEFNLNTSIHELGACYFSNISDLQIGDECVTDNSDIGFLDCELCCWDEGLLSWLGDGWCDDMGGCTWEGPQYDCLELGYDCGDCNDAWDGNNTAGLCFDIFCMPLYDANADGMLNVIDVILVVNLILGIDEITCSVDYDEDGQIDVLDVVYMISLILEGE